MSALFKRAEQLKRYEESETNRESVQPKNINNRKVKFSSGCIFLAACASADKDEVLNLLNTGADINTTNVDGLTALHQACIEDNLDMVEFLVTQGADINRKDNEGWTPLHATSSCGMISIARYLIENGADLAAINSDGELPIDIAGSDTMASLLQKYIDEQGIDCDEARQSEEKMMLADAKKWLRSDASEADRPHPKTGATPLHVAAAKGYTKVLNLLLAARADVDRQDNDGWTPLHASCYWGQKEASKILISSGMADMEIQNYSGQTPIDIAPKDMQSMLEELRKTSKRTKRRPPSQIGRISDNLDNNNESPPKVIRVEVKPEKEKLNDESPVKPAARDQMHLHLSKENELPENDSAWRQNSQKANTHQESPPKTQVPEKENQNNESEVILRRTQSFENDEKFYQKYIELRARIKANSCPVLPATPIGSGVASTGKDGGSTGTTKPTSNYIIQRSASLKDHRSQLLSKRNNQNNQVSPTSPSSTTPSTPASTPNSGQLRRSFVPPTRDEESETQRKAHAKRVRETRRSTQGVTLDEIKSAEQLVKMKNANNNSTNSTSENFKLEDASSANNSASSPTVSSPTQSTSNGPQDPSKTTNISSQKRQTSLDNENTEENKEIPAITEVTLPLRRTTVTVPNRSDDDKENENKDIDNRTGQATQAVIQRRRRPKRRSTGVVHVDMDEIDPDKQESPELADDKDKESGNDTRSRVDSISSAVSDLKIDNNDDGEFVDYKALYEAAKAENDKLKASLKVKEDDLQTTKAALEKLSANAAKNSLSEQEKREKRAMERKISEMEEELKQMDNLRTENQRLKDENGALIRVISKLSK